MLRVQGLSKRYIRDALWRNRAGFVALSEVELEIASAETLRSARNGASAWCSRSSSQPRPSSSSTQADLTGETDSGPLITGTPSAASSEGSTSGSDRTP